MIYSGEILIPKETPLDVPVTENLTLTKGLIHKITIYFPPGNACTAFITINRSIHQIWPTSADSYLKGNNIKLDGDVFHYMGEAPYEVVIKGYAPNSTFDHMVYYYLWVKLPWQISPWSDEMYNLLLQDSLP